MSVILFGATGNIGSEIRKELLRRGEAVTAVVNRRPLSVEPGLTPVQIDINDSAAIAAAAKGHKAAISAYSPGLGNYTAAEAADLIEKAHQSLFDGLIAAGVERLILVGGVGSLEASPGVDVVDSDFYPKGHKDYTLRNREILRRLKRGEVPLAWTYVSPPLEIVAGPRTGTFRLGTDQLLRDAEGKSRISEADFAIAIADELAAGQFIRRRFTAAY
jgi:putative NADH-flavin reductase